MRGLFDGLTKQGYKVREADSCIFSIMGKS